MFLCSEVQVYSGTHFASKLRNSKVTHICQQDSRINNFLIWTFLLVWAFMPNLVHSTRDPNNFTSSNGVQFRYKFVRVVLCKLSKTIDDTIRRCHKVRKYSSYYVENITIYLYPTLAILAGTAQNLSLTDSDGFSDISAPDILQMTHF